jgi:integrator complex subunit 7
MLCCKASSNHHANGSELSKLLLAAESSLDSSSLEMQGIALQILVEIFCILKEVRSDNISVLKGSSFAYAEWQGMMNNIPLTEDNSMNGPLCKIIAMIVNHIISLVNEVASRNICISSAVDEAYKTPFRVMLKLVSCYPSAASVALDILKSLVKELFLIN